MNLLHIDRDEMHDRIAELSSELEALLLLRDVLYAADEGLIDLDEAGRCFPNGDPS